jgi:hypothetical protein
MARTDAQIRASAQRRLARELKAGTFKPSGIGKKAREIAKKLQAEKSELIKQIREYKNKVYGGGARFNQKRSDKNVKINPRTGKDRTIEELRTIADIIDQIDEDQARDNFYWAWDNIFEDAEYESAFYYH